MERCVDGCGGLCFSPRMIQFKGATRTPIKIITPSAPEMWQLFHGHSRTKTQTDEVRAVIGLAPGAFSPGSWSDPTGESLHPNVVGTVHRTSFQVLPRPAQPDQTTTSFRDRHPRRGWGALASFGVIRPLPPPPGRWPIRPNDVLLFAATKPIEIQ